MKLFIDSTNNLKTIIGLNQNIYSKAYASPRDQDVLGVLMEALEQEKCTFKDITSIEINTGPGSFTGIRVGVSIAQMLSLILSIPVNNLPLGTPIEAEYGKNASITINPEKLSNTDAPKI